MKRNHAAALASGGALNTRDRRILMVTCYGHFLSHFNMLAFPAIVLPLASRLEMSMAGVLGLSFWMYMLFGLTALPWGLVADRWRASPLMILFFSGSGVCGLISATAMDSPVGLSIALAGIGLFSGIYHPAGLGLISKEIQRVSVAMGYNGMFGNLGLAMAPLLTGLINWLWGPRAAYVFLGIANLTGVVFLLAFPLEETEHVHTAEPGRNDGISKAFLVLLVAMMLGGVAYRGTTVVIPSYFELKNAGIHQWLVAWFGTAVSKNLMATATTSFIFLIGMLGQFTGGRVADRFDPRFGYLAFHILTLPAVFLLATTTDIPMVLLAIVYFFFLLGMQPIENTLVAQLTPKAYHHSAFGTKFVLTFGVGAVAVKMVESIETAYGVEQVFPTMGMVSVAMVITIIVLISVTRRIPASKHQSPEQGPPS
ncbi:MAG: MFS transporter [Deltaproteobacteria bacterium]|nr:MFS transporter [Deltaproteobacteria bacterium]